MRIVLNNREQEFQESELTVLQIFKIMNYTFPRLVVKLNGNLIKKPEYAETRVTEGDCLEVIHLISGG